MNEFENRLVAVLSEKIDVGNAVNALAHTMLGFGAGVVTREEVRLNRYIDGDGEIHENISEMPIVILKAKPNKLRELRRLSLVHCVKFVAFAESMSIGTYQEEYELTRGLREDQLNYWAIVLFGPRDLLTEWTRRFSLYR